MLHVQSQTWSNQLFHNSPCISQLSVTVTKYPRLSALKKRKGLFRLSVWAVSVCCHLVGWHVGLSSLSQLLSYPTNQTNLSNMNFVTNITEKPRLFTHNLLQPWLLLHLNLPLPMPNLPSPIIRIYSRSISLTGLIFPLRLKKYLLFICWCLYHHSGSSPPDYGAVSCVCLWSPPR